MAGYEPAARRRLPTGIPGRTAAAQMGAAGAAVLLLLLAISDLVTDRRMDETPITCAAGLVIIGTLTRLLPWHRLSSRWTLIWPLLVLVALLVAALTEDELTRQLIGFAGLAFLYVGVTQPPMAELPLLAVAMPAWWFAMDLAPGEAIVRLTVTVVVWVLIAEIPARLLRRLRVAQALLSVRARTDALTGLANRHDLAAALGALLDGDTIVLIDMDHFKVFNDQHGHQAGDAVLAGFGRMLEQAIRTSDLAFRYGGEEFLLLLSQVSSEHAQRMIERIAAAWAEESALTFSAGIATVSDRGADTTLARADAALYAAKAAGRNTTRVHDPV